MEEFHDEEVFAKPHRFETFADPSIKVYRCEKAFSALKDGDDGSKLSSMVQQIVRITKALILRARPADFPVIFCSLCLLRLIVSELTTTIDYLDLSDAGIELKSVWETLCQMFDVSTKGRHPLVDSWNAEEYETLVAYESCSGLLSISSGQLGYLRYGNYLQT